MTNPLRYQFSYRRNLPHIQPPGATFFITAHLYGSLPVEVFQRMRQEARLRLQAIENTAAMADRERLQYQEEKRYFGRFDALLDCVSTGPFWLRDPQIAQLVCNAAHDRDGRTYDLVAYCVMPNHLHIILTPLLDNQDSYCSLSGIMHVLKGFSAFQANELLGRKGCKFWQAESYDHYVRDPQELERIVWYVLNNPVKAGLVDDWSKWLWSYWKYAPM
ncbi:transposase [Promineifilum sp.]|uniref:transposase n=1 Tax=Promineifilum sp. TaxID=2664178 RepID=UPI0035B3A8F4